MEVSGLQGFLLRGHRPRIVFFGGSARPPKSKSLVERRQGLRKLWAACLRLKVRHGVFDFDNSLVCRRIPVPISSYHSSSEAVKLQHDVWKESRAQLVERGRESGTADT